ncbi:HNH endonuclease [bacterium]|nr:HNH endonuclease [bacterium]
MRLHGPILSRQLLQQGFEFHGTRIPLVSPQGIFRPRQLERIPLTITTTPNSPYEDTKSDDGYILYKYRGTNRNHPDNVGLREAMKTEMPLIYFHGIAPGRYEAVWPVYIIGDDPQNLEFTVAVDTAESFAYDQIGAAGNQQIAEPALTLRRRYATTEVRHRLHQHRFRHIVLTAYREQCAICRLRHLPLIDAAHILADSDPEGEPIINNGIALCKIHHAAFDNNFLGVTPDYQVTVREDIRKEEDGPMLRHGLQEVHGSKLILPRQRRDWPDRGLLERKYEKFREAG